MSNFNKTKHHKPFIPEVGAHALSAGALGEALNSLKKELPPGPASPKVKKEKAQERPQHFLCCARHGSAYLLAEFGCILHEDKSVELTCAATPRPDQVGHQSAPYWMDRRSANSEAGERQARLLVFRGPHGTWSQLGPLEGATMLPVQALPALHPNTHASLARRLAGFLGLELGAEEGQLHAGEPVQLRSCTGIFEFPGFTPRDLRGTPRAIRKVFEHLEALRLQEA